MSHLPRCYQFSRTDRKSTYFAAAVTFSDISHFQTWLFSSQCSGFCSSFNCLGHSKNLMIWRCGCCECETVDHSRVKLIPLDDTEDGSDYINASYIPVSLCAADLLPDWCVGLSPADTTTTTSTTTTTTTYHFMAFCLGLVLSQYQKKHSLIYTHHDHQSFFICFLHLVWSIATSLFNWHAL